MGKLELLGVAHKKRLVNYPLHLSLGRVVALLSSEDLHLIFSSDLDASLLGVLVIESFRDTVVVKSVVSPVLHKLNVSTSSHSCRSSLSSIWHYGNLLVRVLISHGNGGGNWIEVRGLVVGVSDGVILSVPKPL